MATSFAIAEVKALVRQPQRAQAQQLLERLAVAVLPILTQRRFPVRRLLEFFPSNGSLLGMNVNRGAKIYIRRTIVHRDVVFLQYNLLLGGETSRRLGTANAPASIDTVVDPQTLRRKVLEAAERRRRDNANCGNAQIMRASHEILGIESSEDEDDDAVSNVTAAEEAAASRERSTGTTVVNAIVLDDADYSGVPPFHPHTSSSSAIVDLIHDDEGQELNIDVSETELLTLREATTSSVEAAMERDRKRKREDDAVEVIDLT
ncbi:hypothetical protein BBJ28_00008253 [Nothophytophthora sp. Chile5]|nr:hypothetical protein BBJ28_00008253 [Nothophytophthora sp. Chile5]